MQRLSFVGRLTVDSVQALLHQLQTLHVGKPMYYLLQRPDTITGWRAWQDRPPSEDELGVFSTGRLFGTNAEVRWKANRNGYDMLWLSERECPVHFAPLVRESEWHAGEPQFVYLQGELDKNNRDNEPQRWKDTRFPADFGYPIVPRRFAKIQVIPYRDLETDTIRFTRFCRFEGEDK
ncbi:MAG: hypothetical protein O7E52_13800 [Candidatus Poribacteria bacterium]|nr:hypothetical protein [Candidatus Poribacteria bacterium]